MQSRRPWDDGVVAEPTAPLSHGRSVQCACIAPNARCGSFYNHLGSRPVVCKRPAVNALDTMTHDAIDGRLAPVEK